jgi:shikimate dehydrogenase
MNAVKLAVIGDQLEDSLLPAVLRAGLSGLGIDGEVKVVEVAEEEFEAAVHALQEAGYLGAAIAPPHKVAAARLAHRFSTVRHALGHASVLKFENGIWGQNNEVPAIQDLVQHLEPGTALVMGAGAGARVAAVALLDLGWRVRVWNRNGMRSRLLQTTLKAFGEIEVLPSANPTGCSLIVNATTLGKRAGEKPPVDWTFIRRGTTVMDLVYRRVPTELLRDAQLRGLPTIDGRQIVVEKAALSLEWWLGQPVDRAPMNLAASLNR